MKKNIIIFAILSFLILLAVGVATYRNFIRPIKINNLDNNEFSFYLQNENANKKHFEEITDWYEAKIDYPSNNQIVSDKIFGIWNDFAKENQIKNYTNLADAKKGLGINVDGLKYSFIAEYRIATSTNYITYVYTIYNFTGGAHGSTTIVPITLNKKNEVVSVEEILPKAKLETVSKLAKIKIVTEKKKRLAEFGGMTFKEITDTIKNDSFIDEGVAPTRENYNTLWPVGDGDVMVDFGQYQVGPYAEGIYEILLKKEEIL